MNKVKYINLLIVILSLTNCAIEEIPRQPLLASPLGLTARFAPAVGGGDGIAMFFTSMNNEIYFTGYAIYISSRLQDFQAYEDNFFPLRPTDVPGSDARLLPNTRNENDKTTSILVGGAMSFPNMWIYPQNAQADSTQNPNFTLTCFSELPNKPDGTGGGPFVSGTTYYFAAYAYSSVDNVYSLPSNISQVTFP